MSSWNQVRPFQMSRMALSLTPKAIATWVELTLSFLAIEDDWLARWILKIVMACSVVRMARVLHAWIEDRNRSSCACVRLDGAYTELTLR